MAVSTDCYFTPKPSSELLKGLQVCACFLFTILVSPVLLLVGALVLIWRIFVTFHLKLVHEGKFKVCSPSDAAYAHESHANAMCVYAFSYVKGQTDIYKLRDRALNNLIRYKTKDGRQPYEKLTWKLLQMYGFYVWETENDSFDIRDHVKYCPGIDFRETYTNQQVMESVEKFLDYTMDSKRPQWELLYVPKVRVNEQEDNQEADGDDDLHFAVILRVQHAYMDGVSILQMFRNGLCDDPGKFIIDPVNPPFPKTSTLERIALYTQAFFMAPSTFYLAMNFFTRNAFQEGRKNTGPKFLRCTNSLATLKSVKHMRQKFKCSTTALFNSAIIGALRRAAERKGLPIPEKISCILTVAVLPYNNEDPQNRFTVENLPAPISVSDPILRLKKINSVMKSVAPYEVVALYNLTLLIGLLPAKLIAIIYSTINSSYGMTNLPGFEDKLTMYGNPVERIFGSPPVKDGLGFGIGVCSYNGSIRACWMVEKSKIISSQQEMDSLIADFETEIAQLKYIANENTH